MCILIQDFKLSGLSAGLIRFAYKASKGALVDPPHFFLNFMNFSGGSPLLVLTGHNPPCTLDIFKYAHINEIY